MAGVKVVIQDTIFQNGAGLSLGANADIEVRDSDSDALVSLWEDRLGASGESNPFTADANGQFTVYANPGRVKVTATIGGDTIDFVDIPLLDVEADGTLNLPLTVADGVPALFVRLNVTQGGIAAGSLEDWHEIGAGSEPAFANSWVNFGGAEATAAFRKLANGMVVIKGTVKDGTGLTATIFTLPVGYRPIKTIDFATIASNTVAAVLTITAAGAVIPNSTGQGANNLNFINCSFFAEQ